MHPMERTELFQRHIFMQLILRLNIFLSSGWIIELAYMQSVNSVNPKSIID